MIEAGTIWGEPYKTYISFPIARPGKLCLLSLLVNRLSVFILSKQVCSNYYLPVKFSVHPPLFNMPQISISTCSSSIIYLCISLFCMASRFENNNYNRCDINKEIKVSFCINGIPSWSSILGLSYVHRLCVACVHLLFAHIAYI